MNFKLDESPIDRNEKIDRPYRYELCSANLHHQLIVLFAR
jgi:hypothetical protein